jgi:hypothetical protein
MITIARFQVPEDAYLFRSFLAHKGIPAHVFDDCVVQTAWYLSNADRRSESERGIRTC